MEVLESERGEGMHSLCEGKHLYTSHVMRNICIQVEEVRDFLERQQQQQQAFGQHTQGGSNMLITTGAI